MKKIKFDGSGFTAERIAAKQFNGELVDDKELQYKDIDLFIKSRTGVATPVSVKDQLYSSGRYGAIQIETKMTNTRTGATDVGCFYKSEAAYYLWRIEYKGVDTWAVIEYKALQEFLGSNPSGVFTWSTLPATEAKNRSYNRYYDRAEGITIPLSVLEPVVSRFIKVKEVV